ncbi:hypothetical protein CMU71_03160 [Elizabethkingia anophelis]|uniref:hypothetical protein n=1 Tax=Elizabethkingia anophelis TaxID=1117645 RepID=UPI00053122F6|nr:hypothetical protein [Elizabethkingia anophelis]KGT10323.1 hypothetical protein NV63_00490 [Elizabethkingia anophelis]MDV3565893.1 hypothetical protein [Elizabethkingia anophelis]MDV3971954.1 hypothetical protein [Elizabethkingia anophelis]OPC45016.1 hypothetical protein BAY02_11660 [Elizabethkingia anophelis]QRI51400.1 hypothetical protein JQC76_07895 [Elizabethkingia anophelis]
MSQKFVECGQHGKQEMALICTHLAHNVLGDTPLGFHEHDEGDMGRPDAWCDQCNMVLDKAEAEDELDEWFTNCDHKIVCVNCWDEVKVQNVNTSDE